jgi:hypothetical protein
MRFRNALLVSSLACAAAVASAANAQSRTDWPSYNRTLTSERFSALTSIDAAAAGNASRAIRAGPVCVNVEPAFRQSKPCWRKRARRGNHHGGNFTKSRILPLIGVAVNAPS